MSDRFNASAITPSTPCAAPQVVAEATAQAALGASSEWSVNCLCAAWCGTCNEYKAVFSSLQSRFPNVQFRWIDVEDEADLVDPLEVDNFPSILISRGPTARFFGVVLPHLETVQRLIQAQLDDPDETGRSAARVPPDAQALAARLKAQ